MARIKCSVTYGEVENDDGVEVPSTTVSCGNCSHETTSYGTGPISVKRCLALLNEECPDNENNFYVED